MIEQICSMALTYAHHDMRQDFGRQDILEAITTIEAGSAVNTEYIAVEKRAIAIHEAGHAVASHVYNQRLESVRLSIKMRGDSGGHHMARSKEERHFTFRDEEFAGLIHTIGAIAAEQVFYGQNSIGVGGDMYSATTRAAIMAGRWSMGPKPIDLGEKFRTKTEDDEAREKIQKRLREIGERLVATASVDSSVLNARDKRQVVTELLGSAYYIAYNLMAQNKDGVEKVANVLMEQGEMYGDEVVALLDSANLKPAKIDYFEESTWPHL
jgi:ATP-dependent Zn protease